MGVMKQKLKGAFGELAGRVKKVIGAARHDRSLEAEGEAEEAIGRVRRKAADTVDRGVDKIGGSVGKAQQKLTEMKNGSVRRQLDR
jgi:uncharacterized protein YjbJ (UPF0337 family)